MRGGSFGVFSGSGVGWRLLLGHFYKNIHSSLAVWYFCYNFVPMERCAPLLLRLLAVLLFLSAGLSANAQNEGSWEALFEDWMEDAGDDEAAVDQEAVFEVLCDLSAHPLNINTATREELSQLPFLSATQIEDLQEYVDRYGPVRSLNELAMIPSLDYRSRQLLMSFLYVGDRQEEPSFPSLSQIARYGHHELTATGSVPLYERKGDENGYLGYPYRHWLRYNFNYGSFVKAGLVASQDAGEPFFANCNRAGYDYYSYYLLIKQLGRLKSLAVGRYRLHFGQGLVINNDFSLGKVALLQSLGRQVNTIRAHSSRMEANYLQGVAATVALTERMEATAFVSHRSVDATPTADGDLATLLTTGYHRTESEIRRRHNATQTLYGGRIAYAAGGLTVGTTAAATMFSQPLHPDTRQLYRRYYPQGSRFWNVGIDYGYQSYWLTLSGETATGDSRAWATVNTASLRLTSDISLMALQRFCSYRYTAPLGSCGAVGGKVQNESGFLLGAQWRPSRGLQLMAYGDYAYHPWARYLVSQASSDADAYLSAVYAKGRWTFRAKGRLRFRQRDNDDKTALVRRDAQRMSVSGGYDDGRWQVRSQVDVSFSQYQQHSRGYMITQHLSRKWKRLLLSASASLFHTDDYETRLYAYERGPLYTMNFPMSYGRGFRENLFLKWEVSKNAHFIGKISHLHYFDRKVIGTGLQQINGRNKTDVDLQLRLKW